MTVLAGVDWVTPLNVAAAVLQPVGLLVVVWFVTRTQLRELIPQEMMDEVSACGQQLRAVGEAVEGDAPARHAQEVRAGILRLRDSIDELQQGKALPSVATLARTQYDLLRYVETTVAHQARFDEVVTRVLGDLAIRKRPRRRGRPPSGALGLPRRYRHARWHRRADRRDLA